MNTAALWIILIVLVLILIFVLDINITVKYKECEYNSNNQDKSYATTCENCGLEFDFGNLDIKMYTDLNGKQHQITQCPRCKNYINVDL